MDANGFYRRLPGFHRFHGILPGWTGFFPVPGSFTERTAENGSTAFTQNENGRPRLSARNAIRRWMRRIKHAGRTLRWPRNAKYAGPRQNSLKNSADRNHNTKADPPKKRIDRKNNRNNNTTTRREICRPKSIARTGTTTEDRAIKRKTNQYRNKWQETSVASASLLDPPRQCRN